MRTIPGWALHPQGLTAGTPRPTSFEVRPAATVWRTEIHAPAGVTLSCNRCDHTGRVAIYTIGEPRRLAEPFTWWHRSTRHCSIGCWARDTGHQHLPGPS